MQNNVTEKNPVSESALQILDSLLKDTGPKTIYENQILVLLDALASAEDAEVVARFPAVLAICARRGLALNSQTLFSRYWETSPKRQNLEKLLLISAAVLQAQGLKGPKNLNKIAASLKPKYGEHLPNDGFQLSSGMHITVRDLNNTLKKYASGQLKFKTNHRKTNQVRSSNLDAHLDRLFSPKQKELVLKKRDGLAFTKTEREYYSRIVRKKLDAIASEELGALARKLTRI